MSYAFNPWMPEQEISSIVGRLCLTDTMLEWGAGGSTLLFPKFVKKYYSIEDNVDWYNKIKPLIADNTSLYLVLPNLPRTMPTKKEEFEDYINAVTTLNVSVFDKVLIDGRARQWCALSVLPFLSTKSIVFIHDWSRQRYHSVLTYYVLLEEIPSSQVDANGLGILTPKL